MKKNLASLLSVLLTSLVILITFTQCKSMKSDDQGVKGTVTWLEGNHMPTIKPEGQKSSEGESQKGKPVKRLIKIYSLTNFSDALMEDGLFQSIIGDPIAEVSSDEQGNYSINLSPGRYSVFTVEEGGLFANKFDGEGNIEPLTIKKGEWIQKDIVINYKAYF